MSAILELEDQPVVTPSHDEPKLAIEWSSRWEEFTGSIKPALARSQARLAGEAPFGLIPLRIMIPSYVLEAFVIASFLFVKIKIDQLRPYVAPAISTHDVIYYSGDELPRTEDLGGTEAGPTGVAGGQEAHHRTQTIKVARGGSLVEKVVDAPNLKLPMSHDAVANLLAIKPDAGPPPAEGLRSTRAAPNLTAALVAPAPNVIRDYTRNGVQLDPVIAPPTSVTRDRPLTAPGLSSTLIAPAPNVASTHTLVAPALAPVVTAPAPTLSRDHPLVAPNLDPSVAPPSANVRRDPFRSGPALAANIVPPVSAAVARQYSASPVQAMDPSVVPPPVSAPERVGSRDPKMTMPVPAVVAPPPSANITADVRRGSPGTVPDPSKAVVPPPPPPSAGGSFMSGLIGKIFGPAEVVAPPTTSVNAAPAASTSRPSLSANVTPPPSVSATDVAGNPGGSRRGAGATLGSNLVAPPPSVGLAGGTGNSSRASAPYVGNPSVAPPPPALGGQGGGTGKVGGSAGSGGTLLAVNVAPPPPSISGGTSTAGTGSGRKGPGLGAPLDPGSGVAPPTSGGSGKDSGTLMSSQPGAKVGVPPNETKGMLAMSPAGADKPGLGGTGGGSSIGRGTGPGSGMNGTGPGAANAGAGHGADPNAHGGLSPANGSGGAGNVPAGNPPVPGVDIKGGSTAVVTLPSFGSDPSGTEPIGAAHTSLKQHKKTFDVTIVATANSGGAFEPYKNLLRGEKSTTYIDTALGTVVMEFADESQAANGFRTPLTAPSPIRSDLPEGLPHARMVVTCTVDASGNIKNVRVLEPGPAQMTGKVVGSIRNWKFEPATRNNQPVEVTAILGFGIDTNDRF